MSKVLKRLYLGDVVKSFGTKQLRKLTTEKPTESIVGTWVFNDELSLITTFPISSSTQSVTYPLSFRGYTSSGVLSEFNEFFYGGYVTSVSYVYTFGYKIPNSSSYYEVASVKKPKNTTVEVTNWGPYYQDSSLHVIEILTEPSDSNTLTYFVPWLKANATKQ